MQAALVLSLALAIDFLLGDPPTALHPVGWIGRLIAMLVDRAPGRSPAAAFRDGVLLVSVVVGLVVAVTFLALDRLSAWHTVAYLLCAVLLLKTTFAVRGLFRAARLVKMRLLAGDLASARLELRALVSRDTSDLAPHQLAAAAVESVAENAVDGSIAPLFYFTLFAMVGPWGPVAALVYRAVNTLDSMIGYRGRYEYLGKAAARCDDVLNWLPSRLGALLLVLAAVAVADARAAWRILRRDSALTASPNAGLPMSAAAGALHLTLEKVGHYRLGDGPPADPAAIDSVCRLALVAILLFAALCAIILVLVN